MKIFLGGIAALVVGIILLVFWWWDFITMIKGLIPVILLVGGGFAAYSGYDEIKEKLTAEPEKFESTFETKTAETSTESSEVASDKPEEKKPVRPRAARAPRKGGPKKKEA
ncbi:MAG: hypothetical protein JSW70_05805 [Syntrophobacterales bacterium]|nr:MAG: hypothetical protein JSW70_05805 [Syntrophobacterales bacterium]